MLVQTKEAEETLEDSQALDIESVELHGKARRDLVSGHDDDDDGHDDGQNVNLVVKCADLVLKTLVSMAEYTFIF